MMQSQYVSGVSDSLKTILRYSYLHQYLKLYSCDVWNYRIFDDVLLFVRTYTCTSILRRLPLLYHLTKAVANGQVSPTILNTQSGKVAPHGVYSHVVHSIPINRASAVPRHMGTRKCFPTGLLVEYSVIQTSQRYT